MEAILSRALSPGRILLLREFLRFGTVGAIGFVADTATVYSLKPWAGLYVAGAVAYVVACTVTWGLNRIWTFKGRGSGSMHRQWALFLSTNSLGFVLNRGTYFLLVYFSPFCAEYPVLAIAAGVAMGMFSNFHFARKIVFR